MSMNPTRTTAKPDRHRAPVWLVAFTVLALGMPPAWAQKTTPPRQRAPVIVNFVNADLEAVTRAIAAMIERPILVDPRVRGSITVYSEQPQSVNDAWQTYIAALRGLGFAVVESAGIFKVVPEADAKLQTGTVSVGDIGVKGDQVITQIFPLRYENPNNLVAVLRPLISANNTINASVGSNALVITDYADNLQRLSRIIVALDQPATTDVDVVPLQHAVAADLAPVVQRLTESGGGTAPGVPGGGGVTVLAESRSNSLIVRAPNAARLAAVRATIARLDRPTSIGGASGSGMYVVHLKNADAVRLATVVRAAFGAAGGGTSSSAGAAPAPQTPTQPGGQGGGVTSTSASAQPSTGGFIQADPSTNSLVITAPEPLYRQVRALIDQLDSRRAQVYIESLIVEVSGGDAADFGIQWQGLGAVGNTAQAVGGGTNFSSGTGGAIIGPDADAVLAQLAGAKGLTLGVLRRAGAGLSMAVIAKALQSQAKTNIVSTPTIITLDNEEAKIVVGENVPFITGQFTQTATAATNPFQTIERKDVGITLKIRPQIGEGGAVRMTIFQEQSSVKSDVAAGTNNAGPSTTKRSIESTVVVDDGSILVLGGLIEDRFVTNRSQVPLLGDLPFIGHFFRTENRERRRSNLMVFLRPIVMRDADSASRLSMDRYDQIRGQQQGAQPESSLMLPINQSPVLPQSGSDPRAPIVGPAPTVLPAPP
jgi:general secretion pathway protein D